MFDFAPQPSDPHGPEPLAVTVLRAARSLIDRPEHWCQGAGQKGSAFCVGRAISLAATSVGVGDRLSRDLILKQIGRHFRVTCHLTDIPVWNDAPDRTHADVIAALDLAIATGLMEHQNARELVTS